MAGTSVVLSDPQPEARATGRPLTELSRPRIHVAWLIVLCLVCNFLMVPAFSSLAAHPGELRAAFTFGIIGCVFAQGNLLAAWLAWAEGPFLRRLAIHWIIAAGLYLIWLGGLFLTSLVGHTISRGPTSDPRQVAQTVALGVSLVSLAAQLPLWIVRQWFGWRLTKEDAERTQPIEPPLAIRDLMLATIIVAASFALARLVPSLKQSELWTMWTVFFTAATVISTISVLPAGAMLMRGHPFTRRLAWGSLYAAVLIAVPWIIVLDVWWYGTAPVPQRHVLVGLSSLMFTFAATLVLTAAIARDRGYRLAWGRRTK
jgi:hypothetical protein